MNHSIYLKKNRGYHNQFSFIVFIINLKFKVLRFTLSEVRILVILCYNIHKAIKGFEVQSNSSVENLYYELTKSKKRELADNIDQLFKCFGSKQARNFLQALGLTKYEIPIESRMMNWLEEFGFPIIFHL